MVCKKLYNYKESEMINLKRPNGMVVKVCPDCVKLGLSFAESTCADPREEGIYDCKNTYTCDNGSQGQCNMYYNEIELENILKNKYI
jgi:hypothetical protein